MPGYALNLERLRLPAIGLLGASVALAHLPESVGVPCPLRTLTGVPCRFCGTTTALRQLAGGHLLASLAVAPFGIVLALLCLLVALGRLPSRISVSLWVLVPVLGAEWVFELVRFHYL